MSKPTDTRSDSRTESQAARGAKTTRGDLVPAGAAPLASGDRPEGTDTETTARVPVAKAYKMYVGGAFVRSESGRYLQVGGAAEGSADPATVNIPRGSRKDARDAVLAAKNAQAGWAGRTAYNRGQILYRLAEMLESRRAELVTSLERGGRGRGGAERETDAAIDRAVYYAGFADKFQSLVASSNPVSGPHFGFSVPDAMGVVAIVAPARPVLLGLVSTILPAIVGGNTVVVVASAEDPRTAILLCECLATSNLPGGVVNLLTGDAAEIAPHLAKHREVAALEAFTADAALRTTLEREGTGSVKRVRTSAPLDLTAWELDGTGQGLGWISGTSRRRQSGTPSGCEARGHAPLPSYATSTVPTLPGSVTSRARSPRRSRPTMCTARTPSAMRRERLLELRDHPLRHDAVLDRLLPLGGRHPRDARARVRDVAHHAGHVGHEDERSARRA